MTTYTKIITVNLLIIVVSEFLYASLLIPPGGI